MLCSLCRLCDDWSLIACSYLFFDPCPFFHSVNICTWNQCILFCICRASLLLCQCADCVTYVGPGFLWRKNQNELERMFRIALFVRFPGEKTRLNLKVQLSFDSWFSSFSQACSLCQHNRFKSYGLKRNKWLNQKLQMTMLIILCNITNK